MKLKDFFARHVVFTTAELTRFLSEVQSSNKWTRKSLLNHHVKNGNIIRIKRGLYYSVPDGSTPETVPIDPWLVASRMSDDAVVSHHSVLSFLGKAHSISNQFTYLSSKWKAPFAFRSYRFVCVKSPEALQKKEKELFGVKVSERVGLDIKVTSLERTLVDLLDRPEYGYGWEEIWRSFMAIEYFNTELIKDYVLLLDNSTVAAKTAFFLDMYSKAWRSDLKIPQEIMNLLPKQPRYMEKDKRKPSRLIKQFNLIVPLEIINQSWGEVI